ncbi:MAG: GNAT family N-acetyltransferase [Gammaproteobacteria bacterium]
MSAKARNAQEAVIRRATVTDAAVLHAKVLALADVLGELHKATVTFDDLLRDGFGETPAYRGLIAEVGPETAGICLFHPYYASWRGRRGIYVTDLYVEPQWQRSGVGRRLLMAAAAAGRELGCTGLSLSTERSNERARAFYAVLGFEAAEDDVMYYLPGSSFNVLANNGDS